MTTEKWIDLMRAAGVDDPSEVTVICPSGPMIMEAPPSYASYGRWQLILDREYAYSLSEAWPGVFEAFSELDMVEKELRHQERQRDL